MIQKKTKKIHEWKKTEVMMFSCCISIDGLITLVDLKQGAILNVQIGHFALILQYYPYCLIMFRMYRQAPDIANTNTNKKVCLKKGKVC